MVLISLLIHSPLSCVHHSTAIKAYLESQQAAVDLGRLHQSAPVIAADINAALVASQINKRKLAVHRGRTVVAP